MSALLTDLVLAIPGNCTFTPNHNRFAMDNFDSDDRRNTEKGSGVFSQQDPFPRRIAGRSDRVETVSGTMEAGSFLKT
jgi:hypothetical protein